MDINQILEQIIAFYNSGGNPKQIMKQMVWQNSQLTQMQTQMENMAQGKTPQEFILQIAKDNGVSEQNLQGIARILGAKK